MKYWSIYLLVVWIYSANAQKPIWNEIVLEEESNLKTIKTDTLGFLWTLSEKGLFKYDGFKLMKKINNQTSLSSFTSICVDKFNNFVIGTSEGNLIQYNPYLDKVIKSYSTKINNQITFLDCPDPGNDCLLLSYGNGVYWKMSGVDTLLTTENLLISNEVYSAVFEPNKVVLATDQGIQIIERRDEKFSSKILNNTNGLGDIIITHLVKFGDAYWASNFDSQIYKIDTSAFVVTIIDLPQKYKVNGLKFIGGTMLNVYTDEGIYAYNENTWTKIYPHQGNQKVIDITLDEENNLWVISNSNALSMANLGFHLIPNEIDRAQAIIKMDEKFWIGSSEGLFIFDGNRTDKILDQNVTCLKAINNDILVGTFSDGIYILSSKGEIIKHIDGWANNPNQSVLYLYPQGNSLYISSLTGVIKIDLIKVEQDYKVSNLQNLNKILGPGYVYQIIERDNEVFFATDRQGLKIIRDDSLQHIQYFDNGNKLGSIYAMTKGNDDKVWFSSSFGYIGYVQRGKVFNLDNERFLKDPYSSLISTSDQKIIMIRNSSIDLYDPIAKHYVYYEKVMPATDQELFLNAYIKEDNLAWLAIPNGIIQIGEFANQKMVPEPIINQVKVNLTDMGEKNSFSEDQNNLEFKYSAAWMTDPDRITYQYKLEGLDDTWRNTRDQSTVYPMLRHGDYNFKVKASVDNHFFDGPEESYEFTIEQPFYKTWWFILLSLIILGGLIRNWRNERKKVRLQKEDLNKKRIEAQLISLQTQLNPHFLFNSFNTLIGLIEENPTKGILFTEKLTDFYRDILEVGKNDLILLKDEVQLLNAYIHLIKERFGEQLQIDVNINDIESYKIPPLTLQLLIENAVKHNVVSTNRPLHISITQNKSIIIIKNKLAPKYGNTKGSGIGLDNIKKRHSLNNLKPPLIEVGDTDFSVTIYLNKIIK